MLYFHHAILNKGSYFYDIERNRRAAAQNAPGPHQYDLRARLLCCPASGEILSTFRESVALMSQGRTRRAIFLSSARVLSGAQDKNLIDLSFQTSQVADSDEHRLLMALRNSGLDDEQALENILSNGYRRAYFGGPLSDPPCPRALRRALQGKRRRACWKTAARFSPTCSAPSARSSPERPPFAITQRKRNFTIRAGPTPSAHPSLGFLFPAFDGRRTNLYNCLYYSHNLANNHPELVQRSLN